MSISLHQASIPLFVRGLKNLAKLLEKGAAHAAETGIDPSELIEARLAPDMLALAAQVQRTSDTAKLSGERLSGIEAPKMADEETTFPQLQDRIGEFENVGVDFFLLQASPQLEEMERFSESVIQVLA